MQARTKPSRRRTGENEDEDASSSTIRSYQRQEDSSWERIWKNVAKNSTIYDLAPYRRSGEYLVPDFKDVIEESLATLSDSEERNSLSRRERKYRQPLIRYFFLLAFKFLDESVNFIFEN